MRKQYDRAYFDKWYRDPKWRPGSSVELKRKVAMTVALSEYYLGRPLRSVLDVGCGEGVWRAPLRRLRAQIEYLGLETSEYALNRYGRSRNIRPLRFGQLGEVRFGHRFDLIVCSDVLHYLSAGEIQQGLPGLVDQLEGLAFLELYTRSDTVSGDLGGYVARSATWYRGKFAQVGLIDAGSHAWLSPRLRRCVSALECGG